MNSRLISTAIIETMMPANIPVAPRLLAGKYARFLIVTDGAAIIKNANIAVISLVIKFFL